MMAPPDDLFAGGHKLFVGGLPFDCEEEELHMVFSTYGTVEQVRIMPSKSRSGLRCAFIVYQTVEAAEDAIEVLDGYYKIRDDAEAPIQVRWPRDGYDGDMEWGKGEKGGDLGKGGKGDLAKGFRGKFDWNKGDWGKGDRGKGEERKGGKDDWGKGCKGYGKDEGPKLFVGTLPDDCSEEELRIVFTTYGEVRRIHLMQPHNVTGMRCAFITYAKFESAEDAITVLNNSYKIRDDAEHPILVRWANDRKGGAKGKDKFQDKGWGKGGKDGGKDTWQALGGWNDAKGGRSWGGGWEDDWHEGVGKGCAGGKGSDAWWDDPRDWGKGGKKGGKGDFKGKKGDAKGGKADYKGGKGGKDWLTGRSVDDWGDGKGGKADYKGGKGGKADYKGGGKFGKGKHDNASSRLCVSNLPKDIMESDLEYVFSTYGKVQKIHIMTGDAANADARVSALVDYNVVGCAEAAMVALQHARYEIREGYGPLDVKYASSGKG